MLQTMTKKSKSDGLTPDVEVTNDDTALAIPLANAIRSISKMMANDASCDDLALAVAQCAVSMLADCSVLVLNVRPDSSFGEVLASVNAPFISNHENLAIGADMIIANALSRPRCCHFGDQADVSRLFPLRQNFFSDEDKIVICKVLTRPSRDPQVLVIVLDAGLEKQAESAMLALAELLQALCAARETLDAGPPDRLAIARAKNEWVATVDGLDDLVCLVDSGGKILRVNRTVERWLLGSVQSGPGKTLHELLHPNCDLSDCKIEKVAAPGTAKQGPQTFVIEDRGLERVLRIQFQPAPKTLANSKLLDGPPVVVILSDVTDLHKTKAELNKLNADLEGKVLERTAALQRANNALNAEINIRSEIEEDLKLSRDELARLSNQLMSAHEDERTRLARELHDSLGQTLSAVKYTIERLIGEHGGISEVEVQAILTKAVDGVTGAIREMRSIAMQLRPPELDEMGVTVALKCLVESFANTYSGVNFQSDLEIDAETIDQNLSTPIYRITQEALSNAVRHASAIGVRVSLRRESTSLILEIIDDGVGFDTDAVDTGMFRMQGNFGRLGMRERATNSGGILSISSVPGEGTTVRVDWMVGADAVVQEWFT